MIEANLCLDQITSESWFFFFVFKGGKSQSLPSVYNLHIKMSFIGLLCDLLWSDPDKDVQGWGENDRGVSFTFGADVVSKFLNRHDLDLICRAHQVSSLH